MHYQNSQDMATTPTDYRTILVNKIEKETEKAYQMTITVSWNDNMTTRTFWFPKSVVRQPQQEGWAWSVKSWFVEKLEKENAFHGYLMNIEG